MRLDGQKIVITGANRGIGLGLVKACLEAGAEVVASARQPDHAEELGKLQAGAGGKLHVLELDVCAEASVQSFRGGLEQITPQVDVLVNNAAVFPEEGDEAFEDLDLVHFEEAFRTNVVGVARVTRACLPLLRNAGHPRVVNISSGAGSISEKTDSSYFCYSTSKAALNMLTRALAAELTSMTVVAVSPGWVRTEMGGDHAPLSVEESAADLTRMLAGLTSKQSGLFLARDGTASEYNW